MLKNILFLVLLFLTQTLAAQTPWAEMPPDQVPKSGERTIYPRVFRTFHLDLPALQSVLTEAPERFTAAATEQVAIVSVPMPDGTLSRFRLYESPVMAPALQAKYPEIRCYTGRGVDDPTALLKCDLTPRGFHAQILSVCHSPVFIDPFQTDDVSHYVVYFKKDYLTKTEDTPFTCGAVMPGAAELHAGQLPDYAGDCQLRRYRLALACTGEYATFHGGTKLLVLAAMNTSMNRINGVYENEFAVTMQIVANNDQIIYLNGATDPYTNDDGGTMLDENIATCNSVIGFANYDIGHVFSTGGGGIAGLGVVCGDAKAWGVTGGGSPVGDPFDIDYVAHEMGHQFGASHTQNNNCNRSGNASMEPGSASTIMGYAGICSPDVQPHSDDYFHAISLQEIAAFITTGGNVCATKINIGNSSPTVNGGPDRTIPKSTPFALTAVGADVNSDTLTYCWEQMDPEFATMPPVATSATGPLFRSFLPAASATRYFPRLSDLVSNVNFDWEELPGVARNLKFRVTVRDNNYNGGCTGEDNVVVSVAGNAGPFVVTAPNTNVTWLVGATQTVTWSVANTNLAPVNCTNVRLLLSTDGGFTYPVVLIASTPNDGSETVTVPNNVATTCRVKVEAVGNVFYDISNQNFRIQTPPTPTFLLNSATAALQVCAGNDAGFSVEVTSVAGFTNAVQLTVSGAPAGAIVQISQNPVLPGNSATVTVSGLTAAVAGTYSLTIQGNGGSIQQSISLPLTVMPGPPVGVPTDLVPADGAVEVATAPILTWDTVQYAQQYFVEVATNPTFSPGSLVFSQTTANDSLIGVPLQPGTVYYWRVRADNDCGQGGSSAIDAFVTGRSVCNQVFTSTDVPKIIDPASISTVSATIQVPVTSRIGDINVFVAVDHTWVGDLAATLISPTGDNYLLFSQPGVPADDFGCSFDNVEVTFDDAATLLADDLETSCNNTSPALAGVFQSIDPLSGLNGQVAQGSWQLAVTDNFPEDGGELTGWALSFCFTDTLVPGILLNNNTLTLGSGTTATITAAFLKMKTGGPAAQGRFTLLTLPQHGTLELNGAVLTAGSVFTQADVDAGLLVYLHNGDAATSDQFTFDAFDTDNAAWIHQAVFHLAIVQNDLLVSVVQTQALLCHDGNSGQITVTATGLNGQYQYSLNGGPLQPSNVFGGLGAGAYTVTVSGIYGFTATSNEVNIVNPAALQIGASVDSNSIFIMAAGGSAPLQYSIDGEHFFPQDTFANLPNGVYTVTVADANGCTATTQAIVAVNTLLTSIEIESPVLCYGGNQGSITVNVGGGQAPFHYSLNGNPPQTNNVFQNLPAGDYSVQVQDNQGFVAYSDTVHLGNPTAISLTATSSLNEIDVVASGGTGALQYSLNGVDFQNDNFFANLVNGIYTVTVRDANGCTVSTEVMVDVPLLTGEANLSSNMPCAGAQTATIEATAVGGIPPYEYRLDNGAYQTSPTFSGLGAGIYTVTVRDAAGTEHVLGPVSVAELDPVLPVVGVTGNDATVSFTGGNGGPYVYTLNGVANASLTDLPNGTYVLVATDTTAGCTGETTFGIDYTPLSATIAVFDVEPCDELINLIVSALGGTAPFQYALDNSTYSADSIFTNVSGGMHTVYVRDAQGEIFNLPVNFTLPQTVTLTTAVLGDSILATAGSGAAPYEYSLDGVNFQSSSVFENLPAGTYVVTVRDAHGCTASVENILIITASVEPALAWGLAVTPNPSAGLFRLQFQSALPTGLYLQLLDIAGRRLKDWTLESWAGQFSTTLDLLDFSEGTYVLRVTDGKNWGVVRLQVIR